MTGRDLQPSSVRLLWIGNQRSSGPEHAVRLLPPLLEGLPNVELVIAGTETDRSEAWQLATGLRVADRIVMPDPGVSLERLLRTANLLLVTGNPQDTQPAIDLATAHGLPTIACYIGADETAQAQQGTLSPYTTRAREIAQLLRAATTCAAGAPATAITGPRPNADAADVPPPLRNGTGKPRASKQQAHTAGAGCRRLLARADPRNIPDRIVRVTAGLFDQVSRRTFVPIMTLDFSTLGLGDTLMAWAGFHALLYGGYRPVAPGCTMYVQGALVHIGTALFARHGVRVLPATFGDTADMTSPILSPRSPQTWCELYRGVAGPDWLVNCFPAVDAQKPALRADHLYDPWERFCLGVTERLLHRRYGWQAAPAEYVGSRLWMPVARRMGLFPVAFLALFKQSLPRLRADMLAFVEAFDLAQTPAATIAIFPTGRSYQAFPADFCRGLQDRLPKDAAVFYVAADDPWIGAYRDAGLDMIHLNTVEELLGVLASAPMVITTDSFTSHAAQLLRDDFLLVLTRDIRENVLHPGANPSIVTNHPRCAPCHYVPRIDLTSCPARYDRCVAFENERFLDRIVQLATRGDL